MGDQRPGREGAWRVHPPRPSHPLATNGQQSLHPAHTRPGGRAPSLSPRAFDLSHHDFFYHGRYSRRKCGRAASREDHNQGPRLMFGCAVKQDPDPARGGPGKSLPARGVIISRWRGYKVLAFGGVGGFSLKRSDKQPIFCSSSYSRARLQELLLRQPTFVQHRSSTTSATVYTNTIRQHGVLDCTRRVRAGGRVHGSRHGCAPRHAPHGFGPLRGPRG